LTNVFLRFVVFFQNTVLEWLQLLRLEQYYEALVRDGYETLRQIIDIAWEDLEEIGFRKLGRPWAQACGHIERVSNANQIEYLWYHNSEQ